MHTMRNLLSAVRLLHEASAIARASASLSRMTVYICFFIKAILSLTDQNRVVSMTTLKTNLMHASCFQNSREAEVPIPNLCLEIRPWHLSVPDMPWCPLDPRMEIHRTSGCALPVGQTAGRHQPVEEKHGEASYWEALQPVAGQFSLMHSLLIWIEAPLKNMSRTPS